MARAPIQLPTIERLTVRNYALYPGADGRGLDIHFDAGVAVLAGINGIGKTTLLHLLLRMLVGPSNPSKATVRDLGKVSDRSLVFNGRFSYFAVRVPEAVEADAVATLEFRIGKASVSVRRALAAALQIREVRVNGRRLGELSENQFLDAMAKLCGLSDAYDYYMVIRYLQFFTEERLPVLWSSSTQFEVFKMLFLENKDADRLSQLYTEIQRIDTNIRNRRHLLNRRYEARTLVVPTEPIDEATPAVTPQLIAEKSVATRQAREAVEQQRQRVQTTSAKLDALRAELATLEYETDDKTRELAQSDAAYISQALPNLDDKLQFLMQGLGGAFGCFVCGTRGRKQSVHIGKKLRAGHCFVCNATLTKHTAVASLPAAKVRKLEAVVAELATRVADLRARIAAVEALQGEQLQELQLRTTQAQAASERLAQLQAQLPESSASSPLQDELQREEEALALLDVKRKQLAERYRDTVGYAQKTMDHLREELTTRISTYAERYLYEKVSVRFERNSPFRVATGVSKVNIPTFRVAMTSSTSHTERLRETDDSVSESQKEFLDLAFRLAVLDMVTHDGPMSLVIETPEASLDTWFMQRAADMMRDFASRGTSGTRRVIATSNLNGTQMIASLLGRGGAKKKRVAGPKGQFINLMELSAAPAVLEDSDARAVFEEELKRYA